MEGVTVSYAGFWKRFVAVIIDGILIGLVNLIFMIPLIGLLGVGAATDFEDPDATAGFIAMAAGAYFLVFIVSFVFGWLYYALMESSSKQGTLGKMALGIVVTDMNGNRISFARATGRYFGKILSGMILYIGYIMAGFTQQKQALHDIMAGCLVVNKR